MKHNADTLRLLKQQHPGLAPDDVPKASESVSKRAHTAKQGDAVTATYHKAKRTPLVDGGICESHMICVDAGSHQQEEAECE